MSFWNCVPNTLYWNHLGLKSLKSLCGGMNMSHQVIVLKGLAASPMLFVKEKEVFVPLDEKKLAKIIPQFQNLTAPAKVRQLKRWLKQDAEVIGHIKVDNFLPNAPKKIKKPGKRKEWPSKNDYREGIRAFLGVIYLFPEPNAGILIISNILSGLHATALQKSSPGFHPVVAVTSNGWEIKSILTSIVLAAVPRNQWSDKHYQIKRTPILDYDDKSSCGFSAQIQDFSKIKVRYKGYKFKTVAPYRDTVLLISGASNAQIKEAAPYIINSAVILLNSAPGDLAPTKLSPSSISAYDSEIIEAVKNRAPEIAALLQWWWGNALEDEDAWARAVVQRARTSFGEPDSRYIWVELDPRKLRNATCYQVFLSFLDTLEAAGFMTADELTPYRQIAEEVFAPTPPEPVTLRHAEDSDVFLEIMRSIVQNPPAPIIAEDERFIRKDKPLAAWRIISGERYLVFLEQDWSKTYAKAIRANKTIESSFLQNKDWEREMQKILCEHSLIKQASSGYRYRYDLLQKDERDKTYVVAIPANFLEG